MKTMNATRVPGNRLPSARVAVCSALIILAAGGLAGCPDYEFPGGSGSYDDGFNAGFLVDEEYFKGYDESWFTVGLLPILYTGDQIPVGPPGTYEGGYWDGVWYAYNDGYFVAYRSAFLIGFSEGYDAAFFDGYLQFLANDQHVEFYNGGFDDAYNDGFSEGRVFGAFDWEAGFLPDWLDAFLDWEAFVDICFDEVGVCTGEFGPVILYEWGLDPHALIPVKRGDVNNVPGRSLRGIRKQDDVLTVADLRRALTDEQVQELQVRPTQTERSDREITLTTTWLERVEAYFAASQKEHTIKRSRR